MLIHFRPGQAPGPIPADVRPIPYGPPGDEERPMISVRHQHGGRLGQLILPGSGLAEWIEWVDASGPERVVLALAGYGDLPGVAARPGGRCRGRGIDK